MTPLNLFKCMSDATRLQLLLIIATVEEACVCDLMHALSLNQPKTSRNLAQLRQAGIVQDERRGKWMYYSLHPQLPDWARSIILNTAEQQKDELKHILKPFSFINKQPCCE
ncbi:MAG: metalloregulator ArsR/SmtB family transcription factor [Glaciecola sp.]|jgi:ArsR family transcriptional regulator, arsenate/arsenite/antimonite-responsive transcriptional repressor